MSTNAVDEQADIDELHWWDLAEVADNDSAIFGPTAWTLSYYWAVRAQAGTVMFAARTPPRRWPGGSSCPPPAVGRRDDHRHHRGGRGQGIARRLLKPGSTGQRRQAPRLCTSRSMSTTNPHWVSTARSGSQNGADAPTTTRVPTRSSCAFAPESWDAQRHRSDRSAPVRSPLERSRLGLRLPVARRGRSSPQRSCDQARS